MTSTAEEKTFLSVAVAAIPRVAEIILEFPPDDRAGALETAETALSGRGVGSWLHRDSSAVAGLYSHEAAAKSYREAAGQRKEVASLAL
jgi:hypothetical protein